MQNTFNLGEAIWEYQSVSEIHSISSMTDLLDKYLIRNDKMKKQLVESLLIFSVKATV